MPHKGRVAPVSALLALCAVLPGCAGYYRGSHYPPEALWEKVRRIDNVPVVDVTHLVSPESRRALNQKAWLPTTDEMLTTFRVSTPGAGAWYLFKGYSSGDGSYGVLATEEMEEVIVVFEPSHYPRWPFADRYLLIQLPRLPARLYSGIRL